MAKTPAIVHAVIRIQRPTMPPPNPEEAFREAMLPWWVRIIWRTTSTIVVLYESLKMPAALYIFHYEWTAQSYDKPYWRPSILWGIVKSLYELYWLEALFAVGFCLPQVLRALDHVRFGLRSFERKVRKDLVRGRKRRRGIKHIDQKLGKAEGGAACYQYEPLDPSDKEIRLLTLHPGSPNEEIRVDITYSSLHDRPQYLALSYVWGAVEAVNPLLVNGNRHYVTQNLLYALQHLRNMRGPNGGISFWIDALCINQDDNEEKSHQVVLMRDIYSQAYKVLVWLAPPSEESEILLARMRAIEALTYLLTFSIMGREGRKGEKKTELTQTEAENPWRDNTDSYYEPPFATHRSDRVTNWTHG